MTASVITELQQQFEVLLGGSIAQLQDGDDEEEREDD